MKLPSWSGHLVAFILSPIVGFFLVVNVVFSDILGWMEQVQAVIVVFLVYALMGWIFHRVWAGHPRTWALWLIIPPGIFLGLLLISERTTNIYTLGVFAAFVVGTLLGLGMLRRQPVPPPAL